MCGVSEAYSTPYPLLWRRVAERGKEVNDNMPISRRKRAKGCGRTREMDIVRWLETEMSCTSALKSDANKLVNCLRDRGGWRVRPLVGEIERLFEALFRVLLEDEWPPLK